MKNNGHIATSTKGITLKNPAAVIVLGVGALLTHSAIAQSGADTYTSKCQMCHAADGTGNSPAGKAMKTPSLLAPEIVGKSDADLIAATKNGKAKMPAYAGKLTDPQIKDVVAYIRTLQKK